MGTNLIITGRRRKKKVDECRPADSLTGTVQDVTISSNSMNDHELHRIVQYVTASTSYARETVGEILRVGLSELAALATQSTRSFDRETLLEYVSQWTMKQTGQPEPLVREVMGCAGRWLDEVYDELVKKPSGELGAVSNDEGDSDTV